MIKYLLSILVCMLCWSSLCWAQMTPVMTPSMEFFIEGMLHRASIDGSAQFSDVDVLGSEMDLDGDFGLESTNALLGKAGVIFWQRNEIILDYKRYHFTKNAFAKTAFQFGGITFPVSVPISPDLTFQTLGIFYGFRFVNTPTTFVSLRGGVQVVDYDMQISASLLGIAFESKNYADTQVVPYAVIAGEYRVHPIVSLAWEFSGGWLDTRSAYLIQPMVKIDVYQNMSVLVGYSRLWYRNDDEKNLFDVAMSGPIVGIRAAW